jgi:outer membrane immunogenic protein
MKNLILAVLLLGSTAANAQFDLKKDFDSLGGNKAIADRAKALDPKNKVRVVQNRTVDRNMRLELGGNFGMVAGGDSYIKTQNWGGNLDFHLNPKWSVGARYYQSFNTLTAEGKDVFDQAQARQAQMRDFEVPEVDHPIETTLAVLNWYPLYGKTNLFDTAVATFDIYTLIGYGRTKLNSGMANTFAAGGGVGAWLSQHFSTRFEVRYQTYEDQPSRGGRKVDSAVFNFGLGILL